MPMTCSAYRCNNHFYKGCGKQFFRFPVKDPDRLSEWITAIKRKNWKPSDSSRICSDHFTDKDYMLRPGATVPRLRLDAVPSVFVRPNKSLKERIRRKKAIETNQTPVLDTFDGKETPVDDQNEDSPEKTKVLITCTVPNCNNRTSEEKGKHFFSYFDIRRMVRRKLSRARGAHGAGQDRPAGLNEYEQELLEYLGEEAFRGIQGAVDTDMPASSGSDPHTSSEGPGTPASGQLPGPAPREQSSPPAPALHSSPSMPGPSHRLEAAAEQSGSITPLLTPKEEPFVILYPVDPDAADHQAASQAPLPTPIPDLAAVRSEVAGIAHDMREEAILANERAEQDQENQRQHLQFQADLVSLLREMSETQRRQLDIQARTLADNTAYHGQMIDIMQVLVGGVLHTSPDLLFPARSVRRAQGDEDSGDAE